MFNITPGFSIFRVSLFFFWTIQRDISRSDDAFASPRSVEAVHRVRQNFIGLSPKLQPCQRNEKLSRFKQ